MSGYCEETGEMRPRPSVPLLVLRISSWNPIVSLYTIIYYHRSSTSVALNQHSKEKQEKDT